MNNRKNENFIILVISLASIFMTIEGIVLKWEFWVPPLVIIGNVFLWFMYISQTPEFKIRKVYYLVYTMLAVFFHGVHGTSFFDVAVVIALAMVVMSFLNSIYMVNLFLAEYAGLMIIQFYLVYEEDMIVFDTLNISRVLLHILIVILVHFTCVKVITDREETEE